jgi:hypothetical protein
MESMFTRKKTVQETEQMISKIPLEDINAQMRRKALVEKSKQHDIDREETFQKRMGECERLNHLIKIENPSLTESVFEKPGDDTKKNPFF